MVDGSARDSETYRSGATTTYCCAAGAADRAVPEPGAGQADRHRHPGRAALLAITFFLAAADVGDDDASAAIALVVFVGVIVGYPLLFETLTNGRTPGKMALGLRVVRDDGGAGRFRHALVRALVGVIEIWTLPFVAILSSLASTKGKRVGDYLAGTVVVRERVPESGSADRADADGAGRLGRHAG